MDSLSNIIIRNKLTILHARDEKFKSNAMPSTMIDLLITLMVLIFISLLLFGGLYMVRSVRRRRAVTRQQLPTHNGRPLSNHQRRLTITTAPHDRTSTISVYDEKSAMISEPHTQIASDNVPEIRITFPDEQDESGQRRSGRVVVVRVGETGVGLEPLKEEEQLPAYEKETGARFHSIDMERIGGLKEKSTWS